MQIPVVVLLIGLLFLSPFSSQASFQIQASSPNLSLRFYGHGVNDIDRVKIRIDPHVPADVGGNFTIEFWMKARLADNLSSSCTPGGDNWINGNIILDRDVYGGGDYGDFGISLANGRIAFGVARGNNSQTICGRTNVANGKWNHIAVTRNATTGQMRIFVNGRLDGSGIGPTGNISYRDGRSTSYPGSDPFLVIGAEKHDAGPEYPSYNGYLEELRVSRVIRYTTNFTRPNRPFVPDTNTVALYHFDEGPAGPCTGLILDSAPGGKSRGRCRYGGSAPAGPVYTTVSPFARVSWRPVVGDTMQIQYTGTLDTSHTVRIYNLDAFDTSSAQVSALKAQGRRVVCYINAGAWEDWRPDADQFPPEVLGNEYEGWPGERWLDIRRIDLLGPILEARLDMCRAKGFDGVDPDNLNGFLNDTGFPLTAEDQLRFNRWLADQAHARGLATGLKNDTEQLIALLPFFDWVLVESCFAQGWCADTLPAIAAGKPVFAVEYTDSGIDVAAFCQQARSFNLSGMVKNRVLDTWRYGCP